jgi:hypothetical protein
MEEGEDKRRVVQENYFEVKLVKNDDNEEEEGDWILVHPNTNTKRNKTNEYINRMIEQKLKTGTPLIHPSIFRLLHLINQQQKQSSSIEEIK